MQKRFINAKESMISATDLCDMLSTKSAKLKCNANGYVYSVRWSRGEAGPSQSTFHRRNIVSNVNTLTDSRVNLNKFTPWWKIKVTEPLPDNNAMRCCICTSLFCVVKIEFSVPCVDVEIEKEGYSFGKRRF